MQKLPLEKIMLQPMVLLQNVSFRGGRAVNGWEAGLTLPANRSILSQRAA
jgi:hypothetical protein